MVGVSKAEDVSASFGGGGGSTVEVEEGIVQLFIGVGWTRGWGGRAAAASVLRGHGQRVSCNEFEERV